MVDFVQGNQITPAGQRILDHINVVLNEALEQAKTDVNALNALAGHYKDYWANVISLKSVDNAQWLREHNYAASVTLSLLEKQDEDAKEKAAQEQKNEQVNELAEKLATLEAKLTEALATNDALKAENAALTEQKDAKKKTGKEPNGAAPSQPEGEPDEKKDK